MVIKPGTRKTPLTFNGTLGDSKGAANLFVAQPNKEPEFDDFSGGRIFDSQKIKGLVDGEQCLVVGLRGDGEPVQFDADRSGATLVRLLSAGIVDENAPHRFRSSRKEMAAAIPMLALIGGQTEPCFVNQGSGLQCLARLLLSHAGRSQLAQFIVDK